MQNPVVTASGTFGYAQEFEPFLDLSRLGAIVVKTITLHPRAGNPPVRIVETPAGMLNAIGLQNVGVQAFVEEKLPYLRTLGPPVIVNIAGESIEDYVELAKRLSDQEGVSGIELNISCPNVADGLIFGCNAVLANKLVACVRQVTSLPLIPKLSPNVTDVAEIARALADAGADAISLINTLMGMAIDVRTRRPKLGNVTGGLSGPAIRPIAVRMVWEVARAVKLPLIGMGGIMTADDALEFL
ncbi:MAG: dihydroorotate dehydrogenase, partial [bacterium]|nr:dihydroorotate dehydrogenase [Candidatus Methylomirabilis sp.]